MKKKLLAIMLCLIFVASLLPISARAADSGTCGENLTWSFDRSTGILTISGTGAMAKFDHAPWSDHRDRIVKIIIEEGCTSISHSAFNSFSKLHTIQLPSSVTVIGSSAFSSCIKLTGLPLEHITEIGQFAFSGCSGLTKVTIPAGVTKVSSHMFSHCKNLKEVILHDKVTLIGSYAFYSSGLTSITIPDSVAEIEGSAFFSCYHLKNVEFGNNLQEMGGNVFSSCPNLETIRLPDSLTILPHSTFNGCTALREVYLGASLRDVSSNAFFKCTNLSGFTLSKDNTAFYVDRGILYDAASKTLLLAPPGFSGAYTVPNGTTKIGGWAFYESGLTEITIPATVTEIGDSAFAHCNQLKTVTLSEGLQEIGEEAFFISGITSIRIPASVTKVGGFAFSGCTKLTKVVFTSNPPEFGTHVFSQISPTIVFPGHIAAWDEITGLHGGTPHWVPDCSAGHTPIDVPGAAADCTNDGLTDGTICLFCRNAVNAQKKIPALGHDFTDWVTIHEPSANQEGLAKRRCNTCGEIEEKKFTQQPPANDPPVTKPPVTEPPVTEPPVTEPPITEPTVTTPTVTEPSITEPTVTDPTVTEPTVTDPSATESESIPATATPQTPQTPQKPTKPWLGIGIIATIVLAGGGISFLLLKKKFRL